MAIEIRFFRDSSVLSRVSYLFTYNGQLLLLNCGTPLTEGHQNFALDSGGLEFASKISSTILTSGSFEYAGALVKLRTAGFKGVLYATQETINVCQAQGLGPEDFAIATVYPGIRKHINADISFELNDPTGDAAPLAIRLYIGDKRVVVLQDLAPPDEQTFRFIKGLSNPHLVILSSSASLSLPKIPFWLANLELNPSQVIINSPSKLLLLVSPGESNQKKLWCYTTWEENEAFVLDSGLPENLSRKTLQQAEMDRLQHYDIDGVSMGEDEVILGSIS
jgi:hypothetical protein